MMGMNYDDVVKLPSINWERCGQKLMQAQVEFYRRPQEYQGELNLYLKRGRESTKHKAIQIET